MVPPGTGRCMSRTQAFAGMVCRKMLVSGIGIMAGKDITGIGQNVTNQVSAAANSGGDARVSASRGYAAASGTVGALGEDNGALAAGKKPEAKSS
ncbi:hypothetical protein C266_15507 [Pandoraea sp. SD6-2]|nr:hypothetical protein C266_15507 [Pandoraea sp. SD6-2]